MPIKIKAFKSKLSFALFIVLLIPAILYLILMAAIKYDEISSRIKSSDLPSLKVQTNEPQKLTLVTSGVASLWKRIEMIESAKKSLDLEYFIFDLDKSSRLITQALLKKAKEGVKVRLIVDFSLPVFKLNPTVAAFLTAQGIEVKYYNTTSSLQLFEVQHRSHRKLLIVDRARMMTGGRNVADDYFEISERYNFFDTDLVIEGSLVEKVSESYDLYWQSNYAMPSSEIKKQFDDKILTDALRYLASNAEDIKLLFSMRRGKSFYERSFSTTCNDTTFVTDHPGSGLAARQVYNTLVEEASKAKKIVAIESPYFILKDEGLDLLSKISKSGVVVDVITNSLYSTDAYYTTAALFANLHEIKKAGLHLWAFKGHPKDNRHLLSETRTSKRWGLHSKRGYIDDNVTLIGTYNVDPRSANLNSELVVICRNNAELVNAVKADMEHLKQNSHTIVSENDLEYGKLISNASANEIIKMFLSIPLMRYFDFLL